MLRLFNRQHDYVFVHPGAHNDDECCELKVLDGGVHVHCYQDVDGDYDTYDEWHILDATKWYELYGTETAEILLGKLEAWLYQRCCWSRDKAKDQIDIIEQAWVLQSCAKIVLKRIEYPEIKEWLNRRDNYDGEALKEQLLEVCDG